MQKQCYYNLKALFLAGKKRISDEILGVAKENDTIEIDNKKTFFALFQHHKANRIII